MESQPLVSVVTPFYNTRAYLAECIESVLRQTHTNWEYTLVNNRSTDGSEEVVQRYVDRYPGKIRLLHTDSFLTQVQNYNFGLAQISPRSKYCKMVQADDWIFPQCLEQMVALGESHPKVGLVAAYELEGKWVSLDGLQYPSSEVPGRDICRLYFTDNISLFGTPTSLLMRSDLVRSRVPFYDERHAPFEDSHACFEALLTWNFGFVHQVLTYSRRDNESILRRIRPFRYELFSRLAKVLAQGKHYLTDDEYAYFLQDAEHKYFYFLGEAALQGRPQEFWDFHKERLASIHYSLDRKFMFRWVSLVLLDYLGNPKRTIEYLWPRRTRLLSAASRCVTTIQRMFTRKRLPERS